MKHYSLLFFALLLCVLPCSAQQFDPEHRHSIEISSGIPPIHSFLLRSGGNYAPFKETDLARPCINIGYTYAINEKWDFNIVLDASFLFYKNVYYPKTNKPDVPEWDNYDWNAEPVKTEYGSLWWVSYNADFRWKWYRTDALRLYTAFGLGYVPGFPYFTPVLPYLAPIGINFGAKHLYGVAELNVSPAATLLLIGAGYRF